MMKKSFQKISLVAAAGIAAALLLSSQPQKSDPAALKNSAAAAASAIDLENDALELQELARMEAKENLLKNFQK